MWTNYHQLHTFEKYKSEWHKLLKQVAVGSDIRDPINLHSSYQYGPTCLKD